MPTDLTTEIIDRFLRNVGDEARRYFTDDSRVADCFADAGGDEVQATGLGLYRIYVWAVNIDPVTTGLDAQQWAASVAERRRAYELWQNRPPAAETPATYPSIDLTTLPVFARASVPPSYGGRSGVF